MENPGHRDAMLAKSQCDGYAHITFSLTESGNVYDGKQVFNDVLRKTWHVNDKMDGSF